MSKPIVFYFLFDQFGQIKIKIGKANQVQHTCKKFISNGFAHCNITTSKLLGCHLILINLFFYNSLSHTCCVGGTGPSRGRTRDSLSHVQGLLLLFFEFYSWSLVLWQCQEKQNNLGMSLDDYTSHRCKHTSGLDMNIFQALSII